MDISGLQEKNKWTKKNQQRQQKKLVGLTLYMSMFAETERRMFQDPVWPTTK